VREELQPCNTEEYGKLKGKRNEDAEKQRSYLHNVVKVASLFFA
jgi:hypothetical protein